MPDTDDELKAIEQQRISAITGKDADALQRLLADDYHLINPGGQQVGKFDLVNGIREGFISYSLWEVDGAMAVVASEAMAVVRYRASLQVTVQGEAQPPQRLWHTEVYQQRDGAWQAVMSQDTRVSA
jgi:uncharacterized protein (TIGR02246 family)